VERARCTGPSRPVRPGEQNRRTDPRQARQQAESRLHGRRPPHQIGKRVGAGALLSRPLAGIERTAGRIDQIIQIKRLWQVFICPAPNRLNRRGRRRLGTDHQYRRIGPDMLQLFQPVEKILVAQQHIRNQQVGVTASHALNGR
jgi:hypothetical protein